MGLESGTYISDLNANNPVNATDVVGEGDDHLRLIKATLLNTFPNVTGAVTLSHAQLNQAVIKDEANTLTEQLSLSSGTPRLFLQETDQAADSRLWRVQASSAQFSIATVLDAGTFQTSLLSGNRSGGNITAMTLGIGLNETALRALEGASTELYFDNAKRLETNSWGMSVQGSLENALGGEVNTYIQLETRDGNRRGDLGFLGGANLEINNRNHGGLVVIQGEDAAGTLQFLLRANPDGALQLYSDGTERLTCAASGVVRLLSDDSSDSSVRALLFCHQDNTQRGFVGHGSDGVLRLTNRIHGKAVELMAEDSGGTERLLFKSDPDDFSSIYHDGAETIRTYDFGAAFFGSLNNAVGGAVNSHIAFSTSAASDRGYAGFLGGVDMVLRNINTDRKSVV